MYNDDVKEIQTAIRYAVVKNMTKLMKGYVHVIFTPDDEMIVRLLDSNNDILHSKTLTGCTEHFVKGFDSNKFAHSFAKELKSKIMKKYFRTPT